MANAPSAPRSVSSSSAGLRELTGRLETLRGEEGKASGARRDRLADAEVFAKGITWALRYDATFAPADLKRLNTAIERCRSRVAAIEAGKAPWTARKGKVVRGFVSAVDGSVQPYAVVVPLTYDPSRPMRLDVVLHGSSKPVGMSELRFLGRFDEGDGPAANAPDVGLHRAAPAGPGRERLSLGRRDRRLRGDRGRLPELHRRPRQDRAPRHVDGGLRHLAPGAEAPGSLRRARALLWIRGYASVLEDAAAELRGGRPAASRTRRRCSTCSTRSTMPPTPAWCRSWPAWERRTSSFRPMTSWAGRWRRKASPMVNLISPGTGHVVDPVTHKEQMRRIGEFAAKGLNHSPGHIRFVTWTLKYSRCHWLQVLGMGEHYARAELEGRVTWKARSRWRSRGTSRVSPSSLRWPRP